MLQYTSDKLVLSQGSFGFSRIACGFNTEGVIYCVFSWLSSCLHIVLIILYFFWELLLGDK